MPLTSSAFKIILHPIAIGSPTAAENNFMVTTANDFSGTPVNNFVVNNVKIFEGISENNFEVNNLSPLYGQPENNFTVTTV